MRLPVERAASLFQWLELGLLVGQIAHREGGDVICESLLHRSNMLYVADV